MVAAVFRSVIRPDANLSDASWQQVPVVPLTKNWRGEEAPPALATTVRLAWTPESLWLAFECVYTELDVDAAPDPAVERPGLWERDVCEAFVQSPRDAATSSYKEFEVAPTGQWLDLAIRRPRVDVDWGWNSGLRTWASIDAESRVWRAVMAVPFAAFGGPPARDQRWRVNAFRIGRLAGVRQYLALAPTGTPTPDFHQPGCFVPLRFTRE